ncbi:hypothetical protein [Dyella mobilis]|uniref:PH domain-containing protein n=1 Tax=Dyella mobilis TaxID=1849582 RepID=A0ABS2KHS7_9GAMM|nr:hypothetical protein [Dyella mobilis]MBM7130649.1 hypothetical protein [Dyella mobilis]
MSRLYQELKIWRDVSDSTAIRYSCFIDLATGKFAVQNADFFHLPITLDQIKFLDAQFVELFIETSPKDRCEWFETLEQAIDAHDRDFDN